MNRNLNDWNEYLDKEFEKDYFKNLLEFIDKEYKNKIIYPKYEDIFKALELTSYKDTKVVILGQDPYHEINEAMGISFSVPKDCKLPPSLKNIFKEIYNEYGFLNTSGDLTNWSKQGILLLNTILTVIEGCALSHKNVGWGKFTDSIISILNEKSEPVCFVLWGSNAWSKESLITNKIHMILKSPHPSPLSSYRGFFGNDHFIKINEFVKANYNKEIDFRTN